MCFTYQILRKDLIVQKILIDFHTIKYELFEYEELKKKKLTNETNGSWTYLQFLLAEKLNSKTRPDIVRRYNGRVDIGVRPLDPDLLI